MKAYMMLLASGFDEWHLSLCEVTHDGVWKALGYVVEGPIARAKNDPIPRLFELELLDILYAHFCCESWPEAVALDGADAPTTCKQLYLDNRTNHSGHAMSLHFMGNWRESLRSSIPLLETDPKGHVEYPTHLALEGPTPSNSQHTAPSLTEYKFRHPVQILEKEIGKWLKVQRIANQFVNLGMALMAMTGFAHVSVSHPAWSRLPIPTAANRHLKCPGAFRRPCARCWDLADQALPDEHDRLFHHCVFARARLEPGQVFQPECFHGRLRVSVLRKRHSCDGFAQMSGQNKMLPDRPVDLIMLDRSMWELLVGYCAGATGLGHTLTKMIATCKEHMNMVPQDGNWYEGGECIDPYTNNVATEASCSGRGRRR
jgi:hypothetical protein